jgi:predicted acyltransferase
MSGRSSPELAGRIASLDQFRGYTVIGMLVVNFLGGLDAVPGLLKHDSRHCSYADTIMPQFFFAVGFAYRLTFQKRLARDGSRAAYGHAVRRCLGLVLLGIVLYQVDFRATHWRGFVEQGPLGILLAAFQRRPFQALVHIGLTALWITPVIAARPVVLMAFLLLSAALHQVFLERFYFAYAWRVGVIDGGPLGFLSWTIPTLSGALAFDAWQALGPRRGWPVLILSGTVLMGMGHFLTGLGPSGFAPPPFVPLPEGRTVDTWTMSQRAGSISYQTFAAGISLAVCALFVLVCDVKGHNSSLFRTFGTNALAAYVVHDPVGEFVKHFVPRDAPGWYVIACLLVYLGICWLFLRSLERRGIFFRI